MGIVIESFGYRTELDLKTADDGSQWPLRALEKLTGSLGIKGRARGSFGQVGEVGLGRIAVGLSVLGFKKDEVVVSYAAFHPKTGAVLAWSLDLHEDPNRRREDRLGLYTPDAYGQKVPLDATVRKQLTEAAGRKRVKTPAAPAPLPTTLAHKKDVFAIETTPDGALLLSTGFDGAFCIWDAETGALRHRIRASGSGTACAPSPDGGTVVTGSRNLRFFDVRTGEETLYAKGHPRGETRDIAFAPSGRWLASTSGLPAKGADNSVALWDPETGACLSSLKLSGCGGLRLAFTRDGARLLVLADNSPAVFSLTLPELEIASERRFDADVRGVDLRVHGGSAFVPIGEQVVEMDARSLETLREVPVDTLRFDVSPDGKLLVVKAEGGFALVDARTGKQRRRLTSAAAGDPWPVRFFDAGKKVVGAIGVQICVWDATFGKLLLPR